MIGETLGLYKIVAQIGSGGMATVYKAHHAAMDRFVAVKVLPANMAQDPNFTARFAQEARTIAKLEHPFILPVYDTGKDKGVHYIVMRYMEAGTLGDLLNKGQPSLRYSVRLIQRIAEALDYAHSQGIVHRDIKPNNILIDKNGQPYLTDFGIAKIVEGSLNLTGSAIIGTPAYMSPEQGQGIPVDNRSDIYSLGVMLYEMVTGRRPFDADTPMAVLIKHMQEPLPPPSGLVKNLPPRLEDAMMKALEKNREDRFATAGEFARALEEAAAGLKETSEGQRPPSTTLAGGATNSARPRRTAWEDRAKGRETDKDKKGAGLSWVLLLGCGGLGLLIAAGLVVAAAFFAPGWIPGGLLGGSGGQGSAAQTATFAAAYQSALSTANAVAASNAGQSTPGGATPSSVGAPTSGATSASNSTFSASVTLPPPPAATSAPTETPGATGCNDNAKFVSDVSIPDNSSIAANASFTKTWRVQNTGTCTWDASYSLKFVGGVQMGGPGAVAFPGSVPPGGLVDLSVNLVAPAAPGVYTGDWRPANKDGALFGANGHPLTVVIVVPATPTPTLPPTATAPPPTPTQGLIIILPPRLLFLASPATFNGSAEGAVFSNATLTDTLSAGDTAGDLAAQGFATFKLNGIPSNATLTGARLDLSNYSTSPGPTSNPFSLGCLRVYQQTYGDLDAGDYFSGSPLGALWRFCSAAELSAPAQQTMDPSGLPALKTSIAAGGFQIRFQFNEQATNNNHTPDQLSLAPKLIVTWTTP